MVTFKEQIIKLPRCKNCKALQIKIIRPYWEDCEYCHKKNEEVEFKEVKKKNGKRI